MLTFVALRKPNVRLILRTVFLTGAAVLVSHPCAEAQSCGLTFGVPTSSFIQRPLQHRFHSSSAPLITTLVEGFRQVAVSKLLDALAYQKGLPRYIQRNEELKQSRRYLEYRNFGEMGLAEMGIEVQYDHVKLRALETGRPLIIVANHPLGIADGLALQYMLGRARQDSVSLLYLARWVEKLLPHAIYGDAERWGTAIPVDINKPDRSDPEYDSKLAQVNAFNSSWSRTALKVLRSGGALIIFPAGHVSAMERDGQSYPDNVYDAPGSWMDGVIHLARIGKADIVFAHIDSVNSENFYRNRKRFGGGDKERIVWFFSEALAKRREGIKVYLSDPMNLSAIYQTFSAKFGVGREEIEKDPALMSELMRQFTYQVKDHFTQNPSTGDRPSKIENRSNWNRY